MFTGIITSLGVVVELGTNHLVVDTPSIDEELGASIAVDGCCLTVVVSEPAPSAREAFFGGAPVPTRRVRFDLLPETIARTRISELSAGDIVNLEPALRAGQPLGGHMVQGHVDGRAEVASFVTREDGTSSDLSVRLPDDLARLCIEQGSITINGVSLTIVKIEGNLLHMQLIPETIMRTNLGLMSDGSIVNVEIDVIARYVDRLIGLNR